MALNRAGITVHSLVSFGLNTPSTAATAEFFERAFGARAAGTSHRGGADLAATMQVDGGAECVELRLGSSCIELWQFEHGGAPVPATLSPFDAAFQHLAIVVADMQGAYQRLMQVDGWRAISRHGPERLPERSGGVTAFKFRDPHGHPLELLSFAPGRTPEHWRGRSGSNVLGIDHSAISVTDVESSVAFYRSMGLSMRARTVNHGTEQEALDDVDAAVVDVVALAPAVADPHVELLGYRSTHPRAGSQLRRNDVAATRLIFETEPNSSVDNASSITVIQDPDGHYLEIRVPRLDNQRTK
jgi:catechol 2,3-dioxygenase-like lactoylglutathione lyase family enzyme